MSRSRKNYTPEEKAAVLKRPLLEKVPGCDLCDELGLNPTVFYGLQKLLFENGEAAFETTRRRSADRHKALRRHIMHTELSRLAAAWWLGRTFLRLIQRLAALAA